MVHTGLMRAAKLSKKLARFSLEMKKERFRA
jgi:hypothetical protein